ncbi:hypothetical protein SAMN05216298_5119 [Glycomyces sambucus]|uniref:Beta-lactamase class A catalytic domain-containing protein n=1 Tax=Glycomyces sambucus TaxID=380244 RepID=A0A1G9MQY5_9ACTN|nr:serine hydrolase [Glycomyces sambucus]SDL76431.1 hypothetical protein SAMN05216298_5119 [Glycomyces sambucus]
MPQRFSVVGRKPIAVAVAAVAVVALTFGVLAALPEPKGDIVFAPEPTPEAATPESLAADFVAEAGLAGEFSFVLYDTAEDRYLLSYRPDDVHYSMSVAKVLIAVGALRSGADPARVAEMISRSDDPIANELWGVVEGPAVIEELAAEMGLEHTAPSPDWGRWGDVRISASDIVRMYEFLFAEVPAEERDVIVDAMAATTELGSDGYDQTFGIPTAADGLDWAVKQGWGCCKPDLFLVSTGAVGAGHRYIAAVFGAWDERRTSDEAAAAEMTAVARFLVDALPEPA